MCEQVNNIRILTTRWQCRHRKSRCAWVRQNGSKSHHRVQKWRKI